MILIRGQERCINNRFWHKLLIFGFEPNHSTAQIIMCLNILLSKGHEWQGRDNVFIGQGDVKAAFDNLTLAAVLDAMKYWKFDPDLTRALLEESLCLQAEARFPGIEATDPFPFNRSIRQSGVEAPWQWNVVMRHLLALLVPSWERRGFGSKVPYVHCLTHLVWADNLYFLASSFVNLQTMMQEFTDLLVHAKLSWKNGSLQVMYSGSVPNACSFHLQQGTAMDGSYERGFKSVATLMLERQHRIIGASFQRLALDLEARLPRGTSSTAIVEQPLTLHWRARKPSFSVVALTLLWKSQAWWEWQQLIDHR